MCAFVFVVVWLCLAAFVVVVCCVASCCALCICFGLVLFVLVVVVVFGCFAHRRCWVSFPRVSPLLSVDCDSA